MRHSEAERYLSGRDKTLRVLIQEYGPCPLSAHRRYFSSLCKAIISQQLSVKAAKTIESRFHIVVGTTNPKPQHLSGIKPEQLREAGLSGQKASYLKSLAAHFESGSVNPRKFSRLSDEQIIESLTQVKGIGNVSGVYDG
jgi:DNA-3-methyladenine glycosylase II